MQPVMVKLVMVEPVMVELVVELVLVSCPKPSRKVPGPTVPTEDRRSIQASTPMGTVSFNPLKLQRLFMYAMVPQEPQEQAARTAW